MSQKLDLNLLKVFAAVYEQGSVTKAADKLNVTQSAVSNGLTRLKSQVGQALFSRTGRGVKPTRFAQEFYSQLQAPLLEMESLMEGLSEFNPVTYHRFVVYCHEAMFHTLRQSLDQRLMDTSIEVFLIEMPSDEEKIYDDLINERVDLVIDISRPTGAMFNSVVVKQEELCCIVKQGHPRLNSNTMSKSSYLNEQHALFDLTRLNLKFVDWITDEVLPQRNAYSEHKSLLGMIEAISYSEAVGVVPLSVAQRYQSAFNLDLLPFPFANHTFDSYMIALAKMHTNQANSWLRDLISSAIE
ncbi:LysR family transcriptional regulator [Vibrio sinaloensis]|uniref:LysR family transcriptional regulator n=1 Tax=Photobacterium sp. (strain ATCC 43367) TaxID=379097 RepID=UPI002046C4BD|nr:LysR family transcriptional regulator [Vibrio sinaloensis]UPQ89395.1 LysR family transcriptional regulator [Vibrio sinaloensis]